MSTLTYSLSTFGIQVAVPVPSIAIAASIPVTATPSAGVMTISVPVPTGYVHSIQRVTVPSGVATLSAPVPTTTPPPVAWADDWTEAPDVTGPMTDGFDIEWDPVAAGFTNDVTEPDWYNDYFGDYPPESANNRTGWMKITPTRPMWVNWSMFGSNADTWIFIFERVADAWVLIADNDDGPWGPYAPAPYTYSDTPPRYNSWLVPYCGKLPYPWAGGGWSGHHQLLAALEAGHTYYLCAGAYTGSSSGVWKARMELWPEYVDIAPRGTPSASTSYYGAEPAKAFDGDPDTHWESNTNPDTNSWLMVDFGMARTIHGWKVIQGTNESPDGTIPEIELQYSNDGTNWTQQELFGQTYAAPQTYSEFVIPAVTARYWRIRNPGMEAAWTWRVDSFELYGDLLPVEVPTGVMTLSAPAPTTHIVAFAASVEEFGLGTVGADSEEPFDILRSAIHRDNVEPFTITGGASCTSVEPFGLGGAVTIDSDEPFAIRGPQEAYLGTGVAAPKLGWWEQ